MSHSGFMAAGIPALPIASTYGLLHDRDGATRAERVLT
jgi:hypothetical protein